MQQETIEQELNGSKSRYEKGLELYKQGKVSIGSNGLFKVCGYYEADTERMTCSCPDYRTRKQSCKHIFASMLFSRNREKQGLEHLDGHSNGNGSTMSYPEPRFTPNKPRVARSKGFDKQATKSH